MSLFRVNKCDKMEERQQILAELSSISPFMERIELINPFTVPAGYFDVLANAIIKRIHAADDLMPALVNTNAYQVPSGYFDGLANDILSKVKQPNTTSNEIKAELEEIAPLLNMISKEEIYNVPIGYFEQGQCISSVVRQKKEAGVVRLKTARRWMQYAAAAVVAGILVTGAFLFTDNNSYLEYEKFNHLDVSSGLNKVSEDELVKYLNSPEHYVATTPESTISAGEETLSDVKTNIQLLSDEELDQYLKENTELAETAAPVKNN